MSPTATWVPFYARVSETGASEFESLFSGVPSWMRESLWGWLKDRLSRYVRTSSASKGYWEPISDKIREIERICRIDSRWLGAGRDYSDRVAGLDALRKVLYANEDAFLTAVDFQLSQTTAGPVIEELRVILEDSSSMWRIGNVESRNALVERVDQTVQRAADEIMSKRERPGKLLAEAWQHAFSMHRNPSSAYRCAVRAVESAAAPIFTPADPQPSLGKMCAVFRDGAAKWKFTFTVDSKVDPKNVLLNMMQLLWTNDYARHIDADPAVPLNVSQDEAESAIILALTLINWFVSGAVARI
jgi:hypothetical protein